MKAKMEKDLNLRKRFCKEESLQLVQRSLLKNQVLPIVLRTTLSTKWKGSNKLGSYKTRIKNYCVLTGRSRSYIRFFRLSRVKMREFASRGNLFGVSKSSW
jgi:small subunit ribosomal protein S14